MKVTQNTKPLSYTKLGAAIRAAFIENDRYTFDKHVPTLEIDGKYVGDLFDMTIFEPRPGEPPVFYHTFSPYDVISGKSSQYAAVFQAAELLFSAEVTPYVQQRTGVMAPLVMSSLGVTQLAGKSVLFVGTGNVARCALAAFKAYYPELEQVQFVNAGSPAEEFIALAGKLGVAVQRGGLQDIESYDVIICHASSKEPVLSTEMLARIKPGAFIATFASEDRAELAADYYDTVRAQVIIDWEQTASEASDIAVALGSGLAKMSDLLTLQEVFDGSGRADTSKSYTIYRSHGTPMQNLAFLQLLMGKR